MVFRDYRRPVRREKDWGRHSEPGEDFSFPHPPTYEFSRGRGEDVEPHLRGSAGADRAEAKRKFRFEYEPVEEIFRYRWLGENQNRDYTFAGARGWRERTWQNQEREPAGESRPHALRYERPAATAGLEEWQIEGPYTGYGPTSYRRSDDRILEEAYERLATNGRLDATQIKISVQDGEITLTGTVKDRRSKRMAEDSVEDILGVQQVNNHLRVREVEEAGRTRGYWGPTAGLGGRLREGMDVIGRDGDFIGTVKRVRVNDFLLDRPWARDIYVPFGAIRRLGGNRVELNVAADEVGEEDWPRPTIF